MANTTTVMNPYQKFYAADGVTPLSNGTAVFYLNKTTTLASIYSDPALSVAQSNPYTLDAGGRITGDVRFSGTLSILLKDSDGATVRTVDDNVCRTTGSSVVVWDNAVTYSTGDIVEGSDGLYYVSIANSNLNNDPAAGASPTKWSQILFLGVWNTNQTYVVDDVVQGSSGELFKCVVSQSGNDPETDFTNWAQLGLRKKGIVKYAKGADIASATALTLGNDGNYFDVTGTTAITSIGTVAVGTVVKLHFDGVLTLTHHATDLILPGGANITTAAGDEAEFVEYATGDWRCTVYTRADGTSVSGAGSLIFISAASASSDATIDFTLPGGYDSYELRLLGVKPATDGAILWMRTSTNGGSSYDSGASDYGYYRSSFITTTQAGASGAASSVILTTAVGNVDAQEVGVSGEILIIRPDLAEYSQFMSTLQYFDDTAQGNRAVTLGERLSAADVDAVQILFSTGNVASGLFALYGVKRS